MTPLSTIRKFSVNSSPDRNYLFKEEKIIHMSKGIAISTILYLLLGVLVVGIIVYLLYRTITTPVLDQNQCRSLAMTWCGSCKVVDFGRTNCPPLCGPKAPDALGTDDPDTGCAQYYWDTSIVTDWNDCWEGNNIDDFCEECCGIS